MESLKERTAEVLEQRTRQMSSTDGLGGGPSGDGDEGSEAMETAGLLPPKKNYGGI